MDKQQAWSKITTPAKSAWRASATAGVNALDMLAPIAAPVASKWDAEADRRAKLRTPENLRALMDAQRAYNSARSMAAQARHQKKAAKAASKNPLSGIRRAARAADKGAQAHADDAKAKVTEAKKSYPKTLFRRAVELHAMHAVPAAGASYLLSTQQDLESWTTLPPMVSAGLVGLNAAAVWLGRRTVTAVVDDEGLSAEERQLMQRLDPSYWVQHADERGLSGTVTTVPEVTTGGIRCDVRLDGKWTLKSFKAAEDNIRALLGARSNLRMRITGGSRGGWAVIAFATRKATDGVTSNWTPDLIPADKSLMSLGLDTETGEQVLVPFDERMLIAGASGTGKSWSTRPLLATAHLRGDLVLIDGKGEEGTVWEPVCRVATEAFEIEGVIDEVHGEMNHRKAQMKKRGISVWDGRQLTVLVDEGQVVLAQIGKDKERLQRLIELSSLGRSRGIVLWWATQKPVMSGAAPGVHNLIAPNLLTRFCLRVADADEARTALDDCADYLPQKIERGKEWRGHGYLKDYGPRIIRTWTLTDAGVKALPVNIWQSSVPASAEAPAPAPAAEVPAARPALRLVKDGDYHLAPPAPVPSPAPEAPVLPDLGDTDMKVVDAVIAAGGTARQKEIAERSGLPKGTVSKAVKRLTDSGHLVRNEDGTITRPASKSA